MSLFAIGLVLLSAGFHALWNFVSKQSRGGAVFVWIFGVIELVLYLPFAAYLLISHTTTVLSPTELLFIVGSGILHLAYFVLLSKGYQVGELSIVYPLARAIGPLIASIAAILIFGERPTVLALLGGIAICGGVFWLTGDPRTLGQRNALPGIRFAGLTGLAIAAYTLWDAYAVSRLLIAPLLLEWGLSLSRVILLTPHALKHWDEVKLTWREDRGKAGFVAIFSSLAYILILAALRISPVSYVAPMRVISTLIGVGMGARFLKEGNARQRLSAAAVMVVGVIALSLG
jgi:drug/metabolite transporter (DMT)-like permease